MPQPVPPKKGMSGCLLAFLIVLGLGVIVTAGVGFWMWREFGALAGGIKDLANVTLEAQSAKGTTELKSLGCDPAMAIDIKRLTDAVNRVEAEIAKKEGRAPRPMKGTDDATTYVNCKAKAGKSITCEEVMKTYVDAADPSDNFVVTVTDGREASCAERYSPDGKRLGPGSMIDIPDH